MEAAYEVRGDVSDLMGRVRGVVGEDGAVEVQGRLGFLMCW